VTGRAGDAVHACLSPSSELSVHTENHIRCPSEKHRPPLLATTCAVLDSWGYHAMSPLARSHASILHLPRQSPVAAQTGAVLGGGREPAPCRLIPSKSAGDQGTQQDLAPTSACARFAPPGARATRTDTKCLGCPPSPLFFCVCARAWAGVLLPVCEGVGVVLLRCLLRARVRVRIDAVSHDEGARVHRYPRHRDVALETRSDRWGSSPQAAHTPVTHPLTDSYPGLEPTATPLSFCLDP